MGNDNNNNDKKKSPSSPTGQQLGRVRIQMEMNASDLPRLGDIFNQFQGLQITGSPDSLALARSQATVHAETVTDPGIVVGGSGSSRSENIRERRDGPRQRGSLSERRDDSVPSRSDRNPTSNDHNDVRSPPHLQRTTSSSSRNSPNGVATGIFQQQVAKRNTDPDEQMPDADDQTMKTHKSDTGMDVDDATMQTVDTSRLSRSAKRRQRRQRKKEEVQKLKNDISTIHERIEQLAADETEDDNSTVHPPNSVTVTYDNWHNNDNDDSKGAVATRPKNKRGSVVVSIETRGQFVPGGHQQQGENHVGLPDDRLAIVPHNQAGDDPGVADDDNQGGEEPVGGVDVAIVRHNQDGADPGVADDIHQAGEEPVGGVNVAIVRHNQDGENTGVADDVHQAGDEPVGGVDVAIVVAINDKKKKKATVKAQDEIAEEDGQVSGKTNKEQNDDVGDSKERDGAVMDDDKNEEEVKPNDNGGDDKEPDKDKKYGKEESVEPNEDVGDDKVTDDVAMDDDKTEEKVDSTQESNQTYEDGGDNNEQDNVAMEESNEKDDEEIEDDSNQSGNETTDTEGNDKDDEEWKEEDAEKDESDSEKPGLFDDSDDEDDIPGLIPASNDDDDEENEEEDQQQVAANPDNARENIEEAEPAAEMEESSESMTRHGRRGRRRSRSPTPPPAASARRRTSRGTYVVQGPTLPVQRGPASLMQDESFPTNLNAQGLRISGVVNSSPSRNDSIDTIADSYHTVWRNYASHPPERNLTAIGVGSIAPSHHMFGNNYNVDDYDRTHIGDPQQVPRTSGNRDNEFFWITTIGGYRLNSWRRMRHFYYMVHVLGMNPHDAYAAMELSNAYLKKNNRKRPSASSGCNPKRRKP